MANPRPSARAPQPGVMEAELRRARVREALFVPASLAFAAATIWLCGTLPQWTVACISSPLALSH